MGTQRGSSFLDIDSILKEQETVPCITLTKIWQMGQLGQDPGKKDLDVEAKVDLPLWISKALKVGHVKYINVDQCKISLCDNDSLSNLFRYTVNAVTINKYSSYYFIFLRKRTMSE